MPTEPSDFAHLLIACLFHDIGYVRDILQGDSSDGHVINSKGERIKVADCRGSATGCSVSAALALRRIVDDRSAPPVTRLTGSEKKEGRREGTPVPRSTLSAIGTLGRSLGVHP